MLHHLQQVKDFGVTVADGAGDDAMAATAILLFGPGGMKLPGGYDTNEMSRCVLSHDAVVDRYSALRLSYGVRL